MVYAKDKKAAQNNQWRTPEYRLHFLSMLGGWVGAKIAQTLLRHKSIKKSFLVKYWITVAINCGVLFWLATIEGQLWMFQGRKLLKLIVTQVF